MELYRYSKLNKRIIKYIETRDLYFQNPLYFNDPFECDLNAITIGSDTDDFDVKFTAYMDMILKRTNFIWSRYVDYSARVRDYASDNTPRKERYYYGQECELMSKELETLRAEINLLRNCHSSKKHTALVDTWNHKKQLIMSRLGVVCLSESNSNILMWSHYADCHRGICLVYESEERPIVKWKKYKYHKVTYCDDRQIDILSTGYENAFFNLLTTKSPDWAYEKEHRLISIKGSGVQRSRMSSLRGIIFGSRIAENREVYLNALIKALEGLEQKRVNSCRFEYYHAAKDPNFFGLKIKKLKDLKEVAAVARVPV